MDKESAEKLSILIMQLNAKLDQSVAFVQDHDVNKMFTDYNQVIGKLMASLYLDIEEKLWNKYPDLRPKEMGGSYQINPNVFEPRFYIRDQQKL